MRNVVTGFYLRNWVCTSVERVMGATMDMYVDLQRIAGKSLQEIEGLELDALGVSDPNNG